MHLIDGKAIAARINGESRAAVVELSAAGITPGLAVVLVGENPASQSYVRSKDKTAKEIGIRSVKHELPTATTQAELIELVQRLNTDSSIHAILVQSPPPPHIDERAVVEAIDPRKDVDGFHPVNIGKLALGDPDAFVPCTPLGVQRLLIEADVETRGARVGCTRPLDDRWKTDGVAPHEERAWRRRHGHDRALAVSRPSRRLP
jgi:methylenetetrahydrofolate dehydrogenase (NADP+)/methenyltetrahydrofolate cyclohydrolase